jgi:L-asparaginase
MTKADIHIFALGGTIAMVSDEHGGARPALSAKDIIAAAPGIDDLANIYAHDFRGIASANLAFDDLVKLAEEINRLFASGADGIVVTQGTDVLEESSFALDLMVAGGAAIFTGAMRHPGLDGSDGPANLVNAVRVAAMIDRSVTGALVVMNGEIHAASEVRKIHTSSLCAFASPEYGPLGSVDVGDFEWARPSSDKPSIRPQSIGRTARVAYYAAVMDDHTAALQSIAEGDFKGLVVAAFGGGHMPEEAVEVLGQMASRMPVVLASRTGSGRILEDVYAYRGAEIDLIARGLIPAGGLDARKSRVFLTLALSAGWPAAEIRAAFGKF